MRFITLVNAIAITLVNAEVGTCACNSMPILKGSVFVGILVKLVFFSKVLSMQKVSKVM